MDYTLGIDIGSTTVKVAILDRDNHIIFSDYQRHFANIKGTLQSLLKKAIEEHGNLSSKSRIQNANTNSCNPY